MSWTGPYVRVFLSAAFVMSAAACTSDGVGGVQNSASCAHRFVYQDRTYQDVGNAEFTVGEKLGSAGEPPCDDTGRQGGNGDTVATKTAYAVEGISPLVAVAIGDSPEEATLFAVFSGSELPPEVRRMADGSPEQ